MEPTLITKNQLSNALSLSTRMIDNLVMHRSIPSVRVGKRCLRFHLAECVTALKAKGFISCDTGMFDVDRDVNAVLNKACEELNENFKQIGVPVSVAYKNILCARTNPDGTVGFFTIQKPA